MKRLILMRHAKSNWSHPGLRDIERPLNTRGEKSGTVLGKWLRNRNTLPDEVLCSAATRTQQTLAGLALPEVPTQVTRDLYLAEPEEMLAVLRRATSDTVLMLAHNPGIAELAAALVQDPPEHSGFMRYPTGATLIVDFDITDWNALKMHSGTVSDFTVPRDLM